MDGLLVYLWTFLKRIWTFRLKAAPCRVNNMDQGVFIRVIYVGALKLRGVETEVAAATYNLSAVKWKYGCFHSPRLEFKFLYCLMKLKHLLVRIKLFLSVYYMFVRGASTTKTFPISKQQQIPATLHRILQKLVAFTKKKNTSTKMRFDPATFRLQRWYFTAQLPSWLWATELFY